MIDIIDLITVLSVGGTQRALTTLVQGSNGANFSHRVFSMMDVGPIGEELLSAGIDVQALHMNQGSPSLFALASFVRALRKARPDVLECWTYHANLLGLIAGTLAGVPRIVWNIRCSNIEFDQYSRLTQWTVFLGARFSSCVDAIVYNSAAGRDIHQAWGYKNANSRVIPNGINMEEFRPDDSARGSVRDELGLGRDVILIGLIARYHPMKDHANFLNAAAKLSRQSSLVHFLLAGDGIDCENLELSGLIYEAGLTERIHLLGRRRDVPRLTAALDIATSSSVSGEGFSNSLGEAMACGVPCVATDVGDAVNIIGDTGVVVPPRDVTALGGALTSMTKLSPAERKALGDRARQRLEDRFSIPIMVESYKSLYREIVNSSWHHTEQSIAK